MAGSIRIQDPDFIQHITNRTEQSMFLFRPDDEFNEAAHYWLRRATMIYEPELYAAVLMSNHPHIIARFPDMNMHLFMKYFQRNLSRDVNILRKRFRATVFPRRYSNEPILDEESFLHMMGYVLCNPVAANLVEWPEEWPGLTTYRQSAGLYEPNPLPLTRPPCWRGLTDEEAALRFRELVRPIVADCAARRLWPVMGAERVKKQAWWKRPRRPKRGKSAYLHGATHLVRWHGANFLDRVQTRYRNSTLARRAGALDVLFPFGTIAPGDVQCSTDEPDRRPARHLLEALYGDDRDKRSG